MLTAHSHLSMLMTLEMLKTVGRTDGLYLFLERIVVVDNTRGDVGKSGQ